jgi:uncharacterized caspase-like protein
VLDRMKRARFRVVLLDACRNNPFLPRMEMGTATRAVDRGLGRIEPGRGEVVFYAAQAGTVASDGEGANSPFAAAILKHIGEDLELNRFFRRATSTVQTTTKDVQHPFVYGSIPDEDFYFKPPK